MCAQFDKGRLLLRCWFAIDMLVCCWYVGLLEVLSACIQLVWIYTPPSHNGKPRSIRVNKGQIRDPYSKWKDYCSAFCTFSGAGVNPTRIYICMYILFIAFPYSTTVVLIAFTPWWSGKKMGFPKTCLVFGKIVPQIGVGSNLKGIQ